jgi:Domain of unknown function (DUF2383)
MIQQSRQHKDELAGRIQGNEGVAEGESTAYGKIYHACMGIKASMTESSRVSILASCKFGENTAQRAYESALASDVPPGADR